MVNVKIPGSDEASAKPERFSGQNFKRWQQRMKFWLTTLGLFSVIDMDPPSTEEEEPARSAALESFRQRDYLCHGRILSALSDALFDVYCSTTSAKELWKSLDKKYNSEDSGLEKYTVGKFLNFKMVEGKSVVEQAHEFQILIHGLAEGEMLLPEKFQVLSIVEKLPPSWEDFGMSLKHRRGKISLEDLMIALNIEEEHRKQHKDGDKGLPMEFTPKANVVVASSPNQKKNKNQKMKNKMKPKQKIQKKDGSVKPCWACGQVGHFAKYCPDRKDKKKNQGNGSSSKAQVNVVTTSAGTSGGFVSFNPELNFIYQPNEWLVDTGANVHCCADRSAFSTYQVIEGTAVTMGNHSAARVFGMGRVDLRFTSGKVLSLHEVHHVPAVRRNLISGSSLVRSGYELIFKCNKVVLLHLGNFIGKGYLHEGLFKLSTECISANNGNDNSVDAFSYNVESCDVWHGRLGHVNFNTVKRMANLDMIPKHAIDTKKKCEICVQYKQPRKPFKSVDRNSDILELVHTDCCEFNGVTTRDHKRYFISFIDDCSRYCYVYLLKTKDEALDKFIAFKSEAENQTNKTIKRLRSDRGGEYTSNIFQKICQDSGIIHEVTAPYSPQSNGIAERKNRTLGDMINAMLGSSGLPNFMWGEALYTACHVLNRVPMKARDKSPYELWKGRKTSLKYLKVWGCLAKVLVPEHKRKKLGPKTVDGIFLGYAHNSFAYRFLIIKSEIPGIDVNTIIELRDATFFEDIFPMKTRVPNSVSSASSSARDESTSVDDPLSLVDAPSSSHSRLDESQECTELRRSKRQRVSKDLGKDFITYNIEGDPVTYRDAMASPEAKQWKEAIKSEMDSIVSNATWELIELPPGCSTIGCKWVFKRKLKPDGSVDKFKARLVAKGFKQKEGIDYFDTYSPVTRITTIRVLLALASIYHLEVHQMDVKTAFLNGDLEEEIYMDQPEGYVIPGNENKVCKLVKSLYGLKQAPKQWHEKFDRAVLSFGFEINDSDKCVYTKLKGDECIILCLYVDDILLFGTSLAVVNETKALLSGKFDMKDMGCADVILGLKLTRSTDGIAISQAHYVEKVLEKYGYSHVKSVVTPYDPSKTLHKNKSGVPVSQLRYSQIIGSLMYLANCSRPDISYAVTKLSRFTSCPDRTHWDALDRVLKYLKGTISLGLHYERFPAVLEGYSDASWIADTAECKGVTGYVFTLGGGAVSWRSVKQTIITRSTSEAELCALDTTVTEADWLKGLLSEIPLVMKPMPPISVNCDNQTTIAQVRSSKYNQKQKRHVRIRLKSIRELVSQGVVSLDFVSSKDNIADPLTKGLDSEKIKRSSRRMGLRPILVSSIAATQPI